MTDNETKVFQDILEKIDTTLNEMKEQVDKNTRNIERLKEIAQKIIAHKN